MRSSMMMASIVGALLTGAAISNPAQARPAEQAANPAAAFCVAQGGRSALRGSKGYCRLPGGRWVEEWAYYREHADEDDDDDADETAQVGMADPAALHCREVGGRDLVRTDRNGGKVSLCRLPSGRTVDAWKHYRKTVDQDRRTSAGGNPASAHCLSRGGRLEPNDDGSNGCFLPNGDVFEEWQLYRMDRTQQD